MATKDSDKAMGQSFDLKWSLYLPDRRSDDLTVGPARNVEIEGRCASCWGQCLALVDRGERYIGLACRFCDQNVDEANVERELKRMEAEARRNLPGARVGRGAEYDEKARFVLKILPDMDRNRAEFDRRVADATAEASTKRKARGILTRREFQEGGTPGFFFFQASALVSGVSALPREISAISLDDFDYEKLASDTKVQIDDAGEHLKVSGSAPRKQLDSDLLTNRMGAAMVAGFGAAFACEIAMKAILLTRLDEAEKTHDLWKLFDALPGDCHERLQGDFPGIVNILMKYRHTFDQWRYFEPGTVQDAVSVLVNLDQIRGLEKAARVILDEGTVSGLQYDIDVNYDIDIDANVYVNPDGTFTTVLDGDSGSTKVSMQIGGGESAIPWEDILSLSPIHPSRSSERNSDI